MDDVCVDNLVTLTRELEINKRPTFYLDKTSKKFPCRAGGVMPYYLTKNGIYFLMIKNNGVYEDFGGKTDEKDRSIRDTIVREAQEESNFIFPRKSIRSQIKNNGIYIHKSKYLFYFIKAEKYYDVSIFGDREIHDNIPRTVEWVHIDTLSDKKLLHYRLRSKIVERALEKLKNQYTQ